jgi:benzoyl-CoA-dihydrodiol lyase
MADGERKLANGGTRIDFQTDPSRYRHWKLKVDGDVATLLMDVDEKGALFEGYELKLNSYDLGVDIELADAMDRLRFEHPQVKVVLLRSAKPRVFCAGANIRMLAGATHAHKVNFCKFTNETRNGIEDASEHSGVKTICVINGTAAGGGYELALAADHIMLVDDGSSAVSLPELPLLAVLPGTGGLTRVTDKRKVRRDHADFFCTTEEGIKGKRAVEWRLVDEVVPGSKLEATVVARAKEFAGKSARHGEAKGIALKPLQRERTENSVEYSVVSVELRRAERLAVITLHGPETLPPTSLDEMLALGSDFWPLRIARELDDAVLDIRLNEFDTAAIVFKTLGDPAQVLAYDAFLDTHADHWLVREIRHCWKRVLKRVDLTSRSLVALIEPGSCFAGTLAELAFATDRSYMLIGNREGDNKVPATIALADVNFGRYPMSNGLSRLASRFLGSPADLEKAGAARGQMLDAEAAAALGLVTFALDDIDWEDEVRIFLQERASFSPDGLTGLEANLRFGGPETMESKIFARLTAWQNWIFQRPNAVGEAGALRRYGTGQRPDYDMKRV